MMTTGSSRWQPWSTYNTIQYLQYLQYRNFKADANFDHTVAAPTNHCDDDNPTFICSLSYFKILLYMFFQVSYFDQTSFYQ